MGIGRLAALLGLLVPIAAQPAADRARTVILERCVKCHSGSAAMSGFDLTTPASLLKGGKNGVAVAPGNAAASRLYQWVAEGKMPMDGKLAAADVAAIRDWINGGAAWSGVAQPARADKNWWAFQPVLKAAPPRVDGATHPIDAFMLARLREKGLDLAPRADHRTLRRRLSFDLTGLPPSPDQTQESYEQAIERLLASPHYGERWGRHWLDVVRFGETDGGEHNNERLQAWPHRDYVIESFNQDKPYDRFIREQIAGDVLAPGNPKMAAATGFLVSGPWDSVSAVLNKDSTMKMIARMDELDDMVTTTSATFLGLTVNCARCHDHKFDPIPTRDYYRMTAVFAGVGFGERDVAAPEDRARRREALAPLEKEIAEARRKLAAIEDPVRAALLFERYQTFDRARPSESRRIPVNPVWNRNSFPPVTARHFRMVVSGQTGRENVAIDRLDLLPAGHVVESWQAPESASPDRPAILNITLPEPRAVSEIRWSRDRLRGAPDGAVTVYRFETSADGTQWTTVCSSLDHVGRAELDLPELAEAELEAALPAGARAERRELVAQVRAAQAAIDRLPPAAKVHAAVPRELAKSFLLDRGSVLKPSEEVSPGALSVVGGELPLADGAAEGARRLALANWIASPANPLTARVIVNRVWYYHFGNGIVNTPSDFGFNGDRPSHPELLDWLAASFIENGWSLKWLHRQILSSRTYQQSSAFNTKAHAADAGNRLLWRMPLKRMDAETLRDSILFAAGNLDAKSGGPSFALQKKGERGSYIYAALDNDGPAVWRRAVYRFVVRGGGRIMMDSFDCPDPSVATPQRSLSNTPVQALTLMNNAFVLRQAGLLAARLEKEAGPDRAAQIRRAYQLLFLREPSEREIARAIGFVGQQPLAVLCRALLNSNEFVYVP